MAIKKIQAYEKMQYNENRTDLKSSIPLSTPYVIYVEPSSYCNLQCTFCPHYITPETIHKQNMSMEVFEKMIFDLKTFPEKIKKLRFCGLGDSLFNKNFLKMAKIASKANICETRELITNGLLLNDKIVSDLPKYLNRIIISIEGLNEDDYFKFTKRKINFAKFLDKIKKLYENKNECVIHIKIHNAAIRGEKKRKDLFFEFFGNICDEIYIENLVDLWPQINSNLGIESGFRFDGGDLNNVKVCPQIFKSMQVNSDGRVLPCCIDHACVNIIGDINKSSLVDIWNGDLMKDLRTKHLEGKKSEIDPCKGCTMNEYTDKDNIDDIADEYLKIINQ